jgi:hypothetical protein
MLVHLPRRPGTRPLAGSRVGGRLTVDPQRVAAAAAADLASAPGVRVAHGRAVSDRGHPLVRIIATVDPDAPLAAVTDAADRTRRDLAVAAADLPVRLHVRVASRRRRRRRVT